MVLDEPFLSLAENLYDGLSSLTELDRQAWILTEMRGLTTREAAPLLGVDFTTVHRRAERARTNLKELL